MAYCSIKWLFVFVLLASVFEVQAQRSDEIWPEVNVFYRINDKFRLFALASATNQDSSSFADGSLSLRFDYFTFPYLRKKLKPGMDSVTRGYYLWLRGGYAYGSSASNAENPFKQHMIITEANSLFYLPWNVQTALKNRIDWRIYNNEFRPRYRPRLMFARDFKTTYLTFNSYLYGEYFFDFDKTSQDRLRLCLGTELRVSRILNFEVYLMRQFDNGVKNSALSAVGLVVKMYLERKGRKVQVEEKEPSAINNK